MIHNRFLCWLFGHRYAMQEYYLSAWVKPELGAWARRGKDIQLMGCARCQQPQHPYNVNILGVLITPAESPGLFTHDSLTRGAP